jgi:hypothetical protein
MNPVIAYSNEQLAASSSPIQSPRSRPDIFHRFTVSCSKLVVCQGFRSFPFAYKMTGILSSYAASSLPQDNLQCRCHECRPYANANVQWCSLTPANQPTLARALSQRYQRTPVLRTNRLFAVILGRWSSSHRPHRLFPDAFSGNNRRPEQTPALCR